MIKDDSPLAGDSDLVDSIRLIDSDGKYLGIMTLPKAKAIAESKEAKLMKIAASANPPIYKLIEKGSELWNKIEKPRWVIEE
jgi:translation initiation factor IF-3